ncbi:MAG: 3-hydroxyacyl-CoA dehydrogenase NAD-binding domain-containing protein [Burkholderiaceae bacterium]
MSQVRFAQHGDLAVITMDNPPVNGLGYELRTGILDGLQRAIAEPSVKAVILTGGGRAFSGARISASSAHPRRWRAESAHPDPRARAIAKPVIAAVHSIAMGGGLELALGCHYRLAAPDAQIALPEVKIGLIPGAGGTQRLPRVMPLERALNMIISGNALAAQKLADTDLFDAIVEGDLLEGAFQFARKVIAEGSARPLVRERAVDYPNADAYLKFAENTAMNVARNFPAPRACVVAVRAAVNLPFDQGMAVEREEFVTLMATPEATALRHAFFAERAASKIPDVPADTPLRPIDHAAVIGAGTMGGGIAMNFVNAGIPVWLMEREQAALDRGVATIRKNYENSARKGRMKPEDVETRMALIKPTLGYDDLKEADIVVEAVFEDMDVKRAVFQALDRYMKPGAILATNTSTLDVDQIAEFTRRPGDVIGTHFFSPANVMKLLEVVRGRATAKDVLATTMALAKRIRKTAVVSGVCDGFIGNRMIEQYSRQATFMLDEGASPQQVDRAIERFGFAMGPFRMGDLAGNDVGWYIRKRRYVEKPEVIYSAVADRICEAGRYGQKTGAGWYRYEAGSRKAIPDPAVDEIIARHREAIGVAPRKLDDDEIIHRLLFALVNEGAAILEEGIALRASDIDLIYLTGYGFPLHRGGPMLYADRYGLYNVVSRMREYARNPHGDPGFWTPSPMLARLAAAGGSFNG